MAEILCFETLEAVDRHAEAVYQRISRHALCPGADLVSIEDIAALLNPCNVAGISFATVVTYSESPAAYKSVPTVNIAPLVALIGTNGSVTFCRADSDHVYPAPLSTSDRVTIQNEQARLAQRLRTRFKSEWLLFSVAVLASKISDLKSETKRSGPLEKEWRFLTGDQPWIFSESVKCRCNGHQPTEDWHDSSLDRQPSVNPRTMFREGHASQCRNIDLKDIRHHKPTASGGASGLTQSPLCWLYDLEQYGCCQNCVFLTHCPATQNVELPCKEHQFVELGCE